MENTGVRCDVTECTYHAGSSKCDLAQIEVTHDTSGANSTGTPHFCKSYKCK